LARFISVNLEEGELVEENVIFRKFEFIGLTRFPCLRNT
jgi:hypothetical protein